MSHHHHHRRRRRHHHHHHHHRPRFNACYLKGVSKSHKIISWIFELWKGKQHQISFKESPTRFKIHKKPWLHSDSQILLFNILLRSSNTNCLTVIINLPKADLVILRCCLGYMEMKLLWRNVSICCFFLIFYFFFFLLFRDSKIHELFILQVILLSCVS